MLVDAASETKPDQRGIKLLIPSPWGLAESVQRLVKAKHLVLVLAVDEAGRLLDVLLLSPLDTTPVTPINPSEPKRPVDQLCPALGAR